MPCFYGKIHKNESRDRVRAAVHNCGFEFPTARVTINLAPADVRKEGPLYDLPIFMAVLCVTGQLDHVPEGSAYIGELSLDGEVRPVKGVLAMVIEARDLGYQSVFVPRANAAEASVVDGVDVYAVSRVNEILGFITGKTELPPVRSSDFPDKPSALPPLDFSDVRGQEAAKRAHWKSRRRAATTCCSCGDRAGGFPHG